MPDMEQRRLASEKFLATYGEAYEVNQSVPRSFEPGHHLLAAQIPKEDISVVATPTTRLPSGEKATPQMASVPAVKSTGDRFQAAVFHTLTIPSTDDTTNCLPSRENLNPVGTPRTARNRF